jgi:hypothetical protein
MTSTTKYLQHADSPAALAVLYQDAYFVAQVILEGATHYSNPVDYHRDIIRILVNEIMDMEYELDVYDVVTNTWAMTYLNTIATLCLTSSECISENMENAYIRFFKVVKKDFDGEIRDSYMAHAIGEIEQKLITTGLSTSPKVLTHIVEKVCKKLNISSDQIL